MEIRGGYYYLGCPYSHRDQRVREMRYQKCLEYVAHQLKSHITVYSPIVHWHNVVPFLGNKRKYTQWDFWEDHDMVMLEHAVGFDILTLPGWDESTGLRAEIARAQQLGLQITRVAVL